MVANRWLILGAFIGLLSLFSIASAKAQVVELTNPYQGSNYKYEGLRKIETDDFSIAELKRLVGIEHTEAVREKLQTEVDYRSTDLTAYSLKGRRIFHEFTESPTSFRVPLEKDSNGYRFYNYFRSSVEHLDYEGSVKELSKLDLTEAQKQFPDKFVKTDEEGFPVEVRFGTVASILEHAVLRKNFEAKGGDGSLWDNRYNSHYVRVWKTLVVGDTPFGIRNKEASALCGMVKTVYSIPGPPEKHEPTKYYPELDDATISAFWFISNRGIDPRVMKLLNEGKQTRTNRYNWESVHGQNVMLIPSVTVSISKVQSGLNDTLFEMAKDRNLLSWKS